MKIQEVMQTIGLSKKALQYYEDKGLIQVQKDESGYRVYDEKSIKRLWEIKVLRKLDFSIAEIKCILNNKQREEIFHEHFNDIDKRMAQCTIQKDYIIQLYDDLDEPNHECLLQEIDKNMTEDFQRNEQIYTELKKSYKGLRVHFFFMGCWIMAGLYYVLNSHDWKIQMIGTMIIFMAMYIIYNFFKRKLQIMPKSPLGIMVDDGIYKVSKYFKRGEKL